MGRAIPVIGIQYHRQYISVNDTRRWGGPRDWVAMVLETTLHANCSGCGCVCLFVLLEFRSFRSIQTIAGPGGVIGPLPRPNEGERTTGDKVAKKAECVGATASAPHYLLPGQPYFMKQKQTDPYFMSYLAIVLSSLAFPRSAILKHPNAYT